MWQTFCKLIVKSVTRTEHSWKCANDGKRERWKLEDGIKTVAVNCKWLQIDRILFAKWQMEQMEHLLKKENAKRNWYRMFVLDVTQNAYIFSSWHLFHSHHSISFASFSIFSFVNFYFALSFNAVSRF